MKCAHLHPGYAANLVARSRYYLYHIDTGVWYNNFTYIPTISDMLREKFHWILPPYMKSISCKSKATVVCPVITAPYIPEQTNCVFPGYCLKINEYLNSEKNHKEMKCQWTCYVNHSLRYCLIIQRQLIVERVNGVEERAPKSYQLLSAPQHRPLYNQSVRCMYFM